MVQPCLNKNISGRGNSICGQNIRDFQIELHRSNSPAHLRKFTSPVFLAASRGLSHNLFKFNCRENTRAFSI
jgi:hypothetical protein